MKYILFASVGIFFVISLTLYLLQRHLIYIPAKVAPSRASYQAEDMQEIAVSTLDGLNLLAWYKPAVADSPTVLYLHGNAGHIGFRMPLVRQLLMVGYGVLLLEYRGYGGNLGHPSESGLYLDAEGAIKFLQKQGIATEKLIIYGESLGTGIATNIAATHSVCAVILQSPFTSLSALASFHYPWVLLKPWDKFDSLNRIKMIKAPMLILHGKMDSIVPYSQGFMVYELANQPKTWREFPQQGHNDLWSKEFYHQVLLFIESIDCNNDPKNKKNKQ